jgi:MYXO-CTERM domain-containing protein
MTNRLAYAASALLLVGANAHAVTVVPTTLLPDAVSYEYFGLNYADNVATSTAIGTLNYGGKPGCAGNCTATTALGPDPFVSLSVAELPYNGASGGFSHAQLYYYVEYDNSVAGSYLVDMAAHDILPSIVSGGEASAQAFLAFGRAAQPFNALHPQFLSSLVSETDCANRCQQGVGNYLSPSAFPALISVEMTANVPYLVELDVWIYADSIGTQFDASIDPTFSTKATGGSFAFSPGVTSAVPEPTGSSALLAGVLGLVAVAATRRRRQAGDATRRVA